MKRYLALFLALLLTTAVLTGCGGASGDSAAMNMGYDEIEMEAPGAMENGVITGSSVSSASGEILTEQKLIRKVTIDAETEDLETLLNSLTEQISALGGYVESQQIYNGSTYSSRRYRSANMTVRIPAENLDGFVGQVKGIANVVNYTENSDDVTLTYVATESRVAALEAEEERLLELMDKAETMADLLEIEQRLTEVRSDLESTASQLRVLANKVSYATVYLNLDQVQVFTEVEEQTVWQRIASGFGENVRGIGEGFVDFFVWAVTYSPQLLCWAAVITIAVVIVKRKTKKRREKQNPPQDEGK